jgi:two-component system, NtrC family, sensor kinase
MPADRILLVDDELPILRAYSRLLEGYGARVDVASSGREACELIEMAVAQHCPYSVLVIDRAMPVWDGFTSIEHAWTADPDLQVVLCTGTDCSPGEIERRIGRSDAFLVVRKPIDQLELVQATRTLATKRRLTERVRERMDDLEQTVRVRTEELAGERSLREQMENEMRLTQRLDAMGQLAAGIAHEINSPVQYVGDNAAFIRECSDDLLAYIDALRAMVAKQPALQAELAEHDQQLDLDYLRTELPNATESLQKGVKRIGTIVGAIRELSHPGGTEQEPADLNRALQSALEVTTNAYRYHCDVDCQLAPLPPVTCHITELGQVFVNLIVNAAHAMESPDRRVRGKLGLRSRVDGEHAVIEVSDTGTGIPETIQARIFEPFFTTKKVGQGTGQGLAIARAIIVERHGGELTFATSPQGTTFSIRIPLHAREPA